VQINYDGTDCGQLAPVVKTPHRCNVQYLSRSILPFVHRNAVFRVLFSRSKWGHNTTASQSFVVKDYRRISVSRHFFRVIFLFTSILESTAIDTEAELV
jgi:hypothetical protein